MTLSVQRTVQLHLFYLRQQGLTPQQAAETIGENVPETAGWDDIAPLFAAAALKLRGVPEE